MEETLATTLILLCAAATPMNRIGGFPNPEEPIDDGGRAAAERCTLSQRFRATMFHSPMRAAADTVAALQGESLEELAIADASYGDWAGRSFADIHAAAPEALARWLADPVNGVPNGEPMTDVRTRVGEWLDTVARRGDALCAITHATVIRAALAHALDLPLQATLAIDIAPLSRTLLSFNRSWRLQSLVPGD